MMNIDQLQQGFALADPRYGPVPMWWWSAEKVTEERIRWQLKKFRDGGLRNIGIIHLAPTGPAFGSPSDEPTYMSDAWWRLVEVALREAERLGMRFWFYDQIGFSGANLPARLVADVPDYAGYHLARFAPDEPLPAGAHVLLETSAYVYASVRQGFNWLDRDAATALIDRVHGEIERRFPHDLGNTIAGSFQDELPPLPVWSPDLPTLYRERYGDDLHDQLPALFDPLLGAEEIRRRVYRLAAELAEQAFFVPLGAWHRKYGMLIGFDQAGPSRRGDPHGSQRFYHDYFRTLRHFNAPGNDMDGETKPHSSMAHLHGGERVWLEAFHSSGWGGTLEETMHWLLPWFQDGATLYNPHAVYYSTRGGWWEWAPPDTGWRQPYYEHYGHFADTISRICYLLSQGDHVCDVAVHYPSYAISGHMSLADVAKNEHVMRAANRDPNEQVRHIRDVFWGVTGFRNRRDQTRIGALRQVGRDFDLVDDLALATAVVDGTRLRIANEAFSVLLLCGTSLMSNEARQTVDRWIANGGLVLAIDVPLTESPVPGSLRVSSSEDAAHLVDRRLPRRSHGPSEVLQRRVGDADVWLLLPQRGSLLAMHEPADRNTQALAPARYRLQTNGQPELWNPIDGSVQPLPYTRDGAMITVDVPFDDWPGALLVCRDDQPKTLAHATEAEAPDQNPDPKATATHDLSAGSWRVRVDSTLDNRYGDFDLHGTERGFLPIERRQMRVRQETDAQAGIAGGWHMPDYDDHGWDMRLWSEAPYWLTSRGDAFDLIHAQPVAYSTVFGNLAERTWMGRMGRVPRRFLHLGHAQPHETVWARTFVIALADGTYVLAVESNQRFAARINGEDVSWDEALDRQVARIDLAAGANELVLRVQPEYDGEIRAAVEVTQTLTPAMPAWIYTTNPSPESSVATRVAHTSDQSPQRVRLIFAARGRATLLVNGQVVTEHGDFHPVSRYGQEEVDVTDLWRAGVNDVRIALPEGNGEVLIDGIVELADGSTTPFCTGPHWHDEHDEGVGVVFGAEGLFEFGSGRETLCVWERPHPLADVGWLMPDAVPDPPPLPFVVEPTSMGRPVWLRFPLPIGTTRMMIQAAGAVRVWIDGVETTVNGSSVQCAPQCAGTIAAVRIEPNGSYTETAVVRAPIRFETAPMDGDLGDWRSVLHLPHFSGAVEYEAVFQSEAWIGGALDLGHVRGTAEVWIDGTPVDVRLWRPYRFKLGDLPSGTHRLRIRVTNTLGAHYEVGRPTTMVGLHPGYIPEQREQDIARAAIFASGGLFGPVTISYSSDTRRTDY